MLFTFCVVIFFVVKIERKEYQEHRSSNKGERRRTFTTSRICKKITNEFYQKRMTQAVTPFP